MRLCAIKISILILTFSIGIGSYFVFAYKTKNEILQLTNEFEEAYKNQNEQIVNHLLADDLTSSSSQNYGKYSKSDFIEGLRGFKKNKVEIISSRIEPIWIQADRENPKFTFDLELTVQFGDGKVSTYYGQYTLIFEERRTGWQIVSINFDRNYMENKPSLLERKIWLTGEILEKICPYQKLNRLLK